MKLQLALRNIRRNGRRTLLNLLMIGGSCAAIINFQGIARDSVLRLENVAINNQYGHLQMAADKFWSPQAGEKPKARLIEPKPELLSEVQKLPQVAYASGRLSFFGLVSRGDESLSAKGVGYDPAVELRMRDNMTITQGRNFDDQSNFQVLLGSGLMRQLGVQVGDSLTLMAYTFDGSVNAIDVELIGTFQTGVFEIDNSTFFVPLKLGQRLMDTDQVENIIVQLHETSQVDAVLPQIEEIARSTGYQKISVRPWHVLATQYQKLKKLTGVVNQVTLTILVLLALLAVGNTVGMSISERIGEIGTARALGFRARAIVQQFAIEGFALGIIGAILGSLGGYAAGAVVTSLQIPLETPGSSVAHPIAVDIQPEFVAFAFALTCGMAVFATLIPAFKASRLDVVEALRRAA